MPALGVLRKFLCLAEANILVASVVFVVSSAACTVDSELFLRVTDLCLVVHVAIAPHPFLLLFVEATADVCSLP